MVRYRRYTMVLLGCEWLTECNDRVYCAVCAPDVIDEEIKQQGCGLQRHRHRVQTATVRRLGQ